MVGLNGAGKTTSCAKIAYYIKNKLNKNPLLVGVDIYRPAAIEQLKKLSNDNNLDFFDKGNQNPVVTAKESISIAEKNGNNVVIIDTAGRMQTNEELMNELVDIKNKTNPDEILLVVDAMSGQDIINVASEFNNKLGLTGFIVTKLDTDARGGAVLSLVSLLNVPIKFIGNGEKVSNLDLFYPERIADRILGLGDIVTLAEQARDNLDETQMKKSFARMMAGKMDLEDLLRTTQQMSKLGSMGSIMKMLPTSISSKVNDSQIDEAERKVAIWQILMSSMTLKERRNPVLFKRDQDRKIRVVKGSGRKMDELNKLLKEWENSKKKMEEMGKMIKGGKNPFAGLI